MIGLDTNVVVRYLLKDDLAQARVAQRLFDEATTATGPCFISLATLLEVVWVLRSRYRIRPSTIAAAIEGLLMAEGVLIQNEREVFAAMIALSENTGSFEDALIGALGHWVGCHTTLTFDKNALKLPGFGPA